MPELEDAMYMFVAQNGQTMVSQIQEWAMQNNLNIYDVNVALKRLLSTGRLYYLRTGIIVANPKKAGSVSQVQPGVRTGSWEQQKQSDWAQASSWAGFGPKPNMRRLNL